MKTQEVQDYELMQVLGQGRPRLTRGMSTGNIHHDSLSPLSLSKVPISSPPWTVNEDDSHVILESLKSVTTMRDRERRVVRLNQRKECKMSNIMRTPLTQFNRVTHDHDHYG